MPSLDDPASKWSLARSGSCDAQRGIRVTGMRAHRQRSDRRHGGNLQQRASVAYRAVFSPTEEGGLRRYLQQVGHDGGSSELDRLQKRHDAAEETTGASREGEGDTRAACIRRTISPWLRSPLGYGLPLVKGGNQGEAITKGRP